MRLTEVIVAWIDYSVADCLQIACCLHAQAKAVAAGANFTIALSLDGKIACFGASGHGQCDLPEQLQALILQDEDGFYTMPCLQRGRSK